MALSDDAPGQIEDLETQPINSTGHWQEAPDGLFLLGDFNVDLVFDDSDIDQCFLGPPLEPRAAKPCALGQPL